MVEMLKLLENLENQTRFSLKERAELKGEVLRLRTEVDSYKDRLLAKDADLMTLQEELNAILGRKEAEGQDKVAIKSKIQDLVKDIEETIKQLNV